MTKPTVGYIGLDHHHANAYLDSLQQLPVSLSSICEPNPEYEPSRTSLDGLPFYRDPESLLTENDPDIVWISLSNKATPDIIEQAVTHGVDVYAEKPSAKTAPELESLRDVVENSDATLSFSYTWRGHPAAQELKERAKQDFFGDVRTVEMRFLASQLQARETSHYLYESDASRGGIVQWLGVHWIDLLPWIMGDPITEVNATTTAKTESVSVEDGAVIQLKFESGALGSLQCGYYLRENRYDTYLSITGTEGRMSWDPMGDYFGFEDENTVEIESVSDAYSSAPRRYLTYDYDAVPGYGGGFGLAFMRQFLRARKNPAVEVPAGFDDAVYVLRVLDAIYESANRNEWVGVSDD
ncbi:putative dehydrogenase (plasmid) [Halalkaliarchaeum sp. AArc-CO]|uniref:Gfo/Idh/MocA family protein n=1 Tax=Halalkaliarchaeum sp. AArc-CO TaxID=2866381 RepID=UPI00217E782D|nr:Gfo/Idh/MocA family oxidoreductase [Halalkaliarchaeum sp. AArc-CO]UWG49302.1 putative dehydrogenase [Halalkaliarchaeum sp. AArc-CO]